MSTLYLDEQAAPGTPASGRVVIYPKADGKLYSKDDAGTESILNAGIVLGSPTTSTSGTAVSYTGLPSGVKRLTVSLAAVSMNGTARLLLRIGPSGGVETSGYTGAAATDNAGSLTQGNHGVGFDLCGTDIVAASVIQGQICCVLVDSTNHIWSASWVVSLSNAAQASFGSGYIDMSGELERVSLTTTAGTATFDAGTVNIAYEL